MSIGTRFFDPLGVMMPITVHFKLLFQRVCERTAGWDDTLMWEALATWKELKLDLQHLDMVVLIQCCILTQTESVKSDSLCGFFNASLRVYAAVVYP